ncbi:2-(1,2-epoxy-1,2-dihydrophenyl)acetyl-CoA isomerase [Thermocatellispora tengchongensis]|uniref:2-(1,2-epoxy-1,2-dihydrophenyl)acetyl-CoA isomerase n=1 Tax=Thermocatellispora tengchongensis TaxID=1073253 RepID=A0A840PJR0_9ACTN|nr:enoyl-CoA hydratase-related protein [Thermocatellispora tengchongensis]MBB5139768.1 2-(1,2-epoxy-1,2-dihydrophenyl)acetyl-CoA isomerase [Thermocatellispora tengchongensis]
MSGHGGVPVLTERDGPVLTVTLNRPDRLNALDVPTLHALAEAWHEAADPAIRAVVVTGAGRGFCAGADLRAPREGLHPGSSGLRHTYHPHMLAMAALDKPVIAAVNGPAAGAGLSLAAAADLRVAAEEATFVPAFVSVGLIPDAGAGHFLPRLLGYARAYEWVATGRRLSAAEALAWGLVSEVVPAADLMPHATRLAHTLAGMPGRAVGLTKRLFTHGLNSDLAGLLDEEARLQALAVAAPGREQARAAVVGRISAKREDV